ncbi:Uu.00g059580.m01.CDS01 [Anthostomella pinea]|uniref:Uu.00g059580.m01.CDS01 n=1 Tax=Anthostomella pinea TaxID=933095 RepID=A0AAI8VS56_9PEZI|nr:Uu.00g059580.m01.CDS01 [Anthostomella pinea]
MRKDCNGRKDRVANSSLVKVVQSEEANALRCSRINSNVFRYFQDACVAYAQPGTEDEMKRRREVEDVK